MVPYYLQDFKDKIYYLQDIAWKDKLQKMSNISKITKKKVIFF